MKVLMIGPDRSVHGGVSGVVNNLYEAGLDQKVDLYYIGTMVDGSKARKLWQAIKAYILFLCRISSYDIVHVHMASDSSYYRKSIFIKTAKRLHKKVVLHQHGGNFQEFYTEELSDKGRDAVKKVFTMSDKLLVLGKVWKDFFATVTGRDDIMLLPNSIQIPPLPAKRYDMHKILFLGRLCKEKGIEELFAAMQKLRETYPDATLYLGGIWEDKELEKKAANLGDCITYLGWLSGKKKQKYLEECDIFVLPSYFEGQPVSLLEAMAYACAIVASDVGSIPDMIVDGETGLLTPPGDTETLTNCLLTLLGQPELSGQLAGKARRKAEEEFSIEDTVKQLTEIYQSL
ncbi:MAG: glycosyltransferase family 4 protein [Blautia sp.]|nr:glycosyltransferase family 4 protein [Lachnoclostridium sp.]MCM1211531.1 glycosyltransferase family 4 protein [Blautia sp.]